MKETFRELQNKIRKKEAKIAVVGLGYVGLPLALAFVEANFCVFGIDVDKDRISHIRDRRSYISDISDKELRKALATGRFIVSSGFRDLKETSIVLICVPTPLKRKYHPNISYIKQAVRAIARNLKRASLVILESTTYPGTTEEVILPLFESCGLRHGEDFYLAFSPERIDPGSKNYPLTKIPKIIGGIDKEATQLGALIYQKIIDKVVPVSSARAAETAKLLENTFRLVNIGLIDELAMMCHRMNIDIWEVIEAAGTKPFGFMPFYPGPGVGGHCIPKDPLYLYWKARHHGFKSRFIKLASEVISSMPEYVVNRIEESLKKRGLYLKKASVLVIGVTYKKDIKDLRKSPSIDIIDILQKRGVKVSYFDPLIPYLKLNHINLRSIDLKKDCLKNVDCTLIATDHSSIDYTFLLRYAPFIFDARNVYKGRQDRKVVFL